jgi:hypothetical protein
MRFGFLSIIILTSSFANCQLNREFEGIIKYQHKFIFNSTDVDTLEVIDALGVSSNFYYKSGNYKWVINSDNNNKIEYFDAITQTVYSLYGENDTLFMSKKNGYDDSLLVFNIVDIDDTICGLKCKKAETISFTKNDTDLQTQRTLYYNPAVSIAPNRFTSYRTYATNKVVREIKCWPVRIELESKLMPFIFILEAIEIIPKQLSEAEVYLPINKPIKPLSLF